MTTNTAHVFKLDQWKQLDRCLILGQEGNCYRAGENKMSLANSKVLIDCLQENGVQVVNRIVEISDAGRAPKNDQAIEALALAAASKNPEVRKAALSALPKICRIPTHLFQFAEAKKEIDKSWNRSLRTAVSNWYKNREPKNLAMQVLKYQSRNGWANRDMLRLSHATPTSPEMNAIFRWVVGGKEAVANQNKVGGNLTAHLHPLLAAYDELQRTEEESEVIKMIIEFGMPREAVPTSWLNSPAVWEALLNHMGLTAMVRNLGKMTSVGLLKPLSSASKLVEAALTSDARLKKERVHPIALLLASGIYGQGHGDKGKLSWTPDQKIVDALDSGFYQAFATIEPTGKNFLLALDVSGSMGWSNIAGAPGITPAKAAAAMSLITARTEKNCHIFGFADTFREMGISPKMSLAEVMRKTEMQNFGSTNCALPMEYAEKNKLDVDAIVVYTDNDTNTGNVAPYKALQSYREKMNKPETKLIVVGMQSSGFTIADPSDPGMMDMVGFDSHAPRIVSDFVRGAF